MYDINLFKERLKELSEEKGLNDPALAREIGVNSATINGLTRGAHLPSRDTLYRLTSYFDCSASFLLGLTEDQGKFVEPSAKKFSRILAEELKAAKKTKYRLNKDLRISNNQLFLWTNDLSVPSVDSLLKLAEYLDCDLDILLGQE